MERRRRRTQKEIFVDRLLEIAGGEDSFVGNSKLRDQLRWNQMKYDRIKKELIESGSIVAGPGQGGTVKVSKSEGNAAKIFVSYCHADKTLKQEMLKHLMPLKRLGLIETWTDMEIKAGDEWDKEISRNLESADIVLLLVSIDFINSKYCYDVELEQAIARHQKKLARVIPVIVRPCMWKYTPFARFQALPSDAKAVSTWSDRDEALSNVAEGIYNVAEDLGK